MVGMLASPDICGQIFAVTYALLGCNPVPAASGGGNSSDLRWDGRNPDENEQSNKRICMMTAIAIVADKNRPRGRR